MSRWLQSGLYRLSYPQSHLLFQLFILMNWMPNIIIEIAKFNIILSAQEKAQLPEYKGSTLRGSFGHAFKRTVCPVPNQGCRQACQMPNVCPYAYIFETPLPVNSQMMRKYTHAPHPFVIEPPLTEQTI